MAVRTARLQVPIDNEVLDQLHILAEDIGFDSVPAMVRFWAKGHISQQAHKGELNRSKLIVLQYVELILAMSPDSKSADSVLFDLVKKLQQAKFGKVFKDLPQRPTSDRIFST